MLRNDSFYWYFSKNDIKKVYNSIIPKEFEVIYDFFIEKKFETEGTNGPKTKNLTGFKNF